MGSKDNESLSLLSSLVVVFFAWVGNVLPGSDENKSMRDVVGMSEE